MVRGDEKVRWECLLEFHEEAPTPTCVLEGAWRAGVEGGQEEVNLTSAATTISWRSWPVSLKEAFSRSKLFFINGGRCSEKKEKAKKKASTKPVNGTSTPLLTFSHQPWSQQSGSTPRLFTARSLHCSIPGRSVPLLVAFSALSSLTCKLEVSRECAF